MLPLRFGFKSLPRIVVTIGFSIALACSAAEFPTKPIRLVVPFAAGGSTDQIGRIVADGLTRELGYAVVPDNKVGAGGTIGSAAVAAAPKDGYTLLMATSAAISMAPNLYSKLPYDPERSFAPITMIAHGPAVLLVNNDVPVKNVQELIDLAKRPGNGMTFASAGSGSIQFIYGSMLNKLAAINLLHVPYKGGSEAANDVIAGRVTVMFDSAPSALSIIRTGKVRALAVTSEQRLALLPDVPSIRDTVKGFGTVGWYGLLAPAGTPQPVVDSLNVAMMKVLKQPETVKRFSEMGLLVIPSSAGEMTLRIQEEIPYYRTLATNFGLKPQ
ncbi:MAG: tripartite tricarboxylate transporter substrate binding protein [Pseudomonadota bacterium]